ncbi:MAG: FAD-dependent oxidoreductase [Deltaproteobacteria bacterium]|nr:FAD-dependent oxidoreductase [Deltaproteobacteria bacterium]
MNAEKPSNTGAVLVVGAGISGMQSALDLANAGFKVYLVDRNVNIGGVMAQLDKTFPTNDCSTCLISPNLIEVAASPKSEIITRARVERLSGEPGNFLAEIFKEPRFVKEEACTGCGECVKVCPVNVPADFNQGLNKRKAIYRHFPQAVPSTFAIDRRGTSPCKAACPAHISVQGYVALIAQGKFTEALALIRQENPLPFVCGYVCTHPCEGVCRRGEIEEPIAIRELKRFVADLESHSGPVRLKAPEEKRPQRVAVIGSGPAGLTCAYYLARQGYPVTIFEALPKAGGMLTVGIPNYRLPQKVIDREIEAIQSLGVTLALNAPIGPERTLEQLKAEGFAAVFTAIGAHQGLRLGVEGEDLAGVVAGVDLLRKTALGEPVEVGRRVAVIGGGNVAIDAVRTALRLGAEEALVLYRRTREEMPAYGEEIEEALEEGVEIRYLTAPVRLLGDENGKLKAVECLRMELGEPDASGRRRPVPVAGSEFEIPVDTVVTAISQQPEAGKLQAPEAVRISRQGTLQVDPVTLQTDVPWIFAGGDAVLGPRTVIEAIAQGKEAAVSIDRFLQGQDLAAGREKTFEIAEPEMTGLLREPRCRPRLRDPRVRRQDFEEVVEVLTPEEAQTEAARCLACGICSECYQCLEVCQAGAIDHALTGERLTLEVGAVIASPGFEIFDARLKEEYGYGRYPNVLTSLEFERVLSASGPFGGHVQRPTDGREPQKIAWIQCVGSRDASLQRDYCSYVCCMYATKQAVIAKEHLPGLEPTIFFIDIRAQGKGFDRYYERAKGEHGVRYIRSLISRVTQDPRTNNLQLSYIDETNEFKTEEFDLVILSVGLAPHSRSAELAACLQIRTDRFGFCENPPLDTTGTTRPGIFTGGVFQNPKDIPETVTQASGAAAAAGALLHEARGTQIREISFPEERPVQREEPRVGVFICHCGINIAGIVDVAEVAAYARTLPGVVYTDHLLFTCSTDSQETMLRLIQEQGLNRVVVASCSPRTHEGLFRDTLRKAGLNKYLFEMANIRDQCSWVHQAHPATATAKAKDLVRMAVARAGLLTPLYEIPYEVDQRALVVGAGLAGMTAALNLADQGFETFLVERSDQLGGVARRIHRTLEGVDVQQYLQETTRRVIGHPRIRLFTNTELLETSGTVGKFTSRLSHRGEQRTVEHGAVVVATGGAEYRPAEYRYGEHPGIMTQLELQEELFTKPDRIREAGAVVMIQCVGSREEQHPYCSRVCCATAVNNALKIKEVSPRTEVVVLYRDIRTYARKELYYKKAREAGVRFIRFEPEKRPEVELVEGKLEVRVFDQNLKAGLRLRPDRIALSAAIRPAASIRPLAQALKLPFDADGFFLEAHIKLRPLDFANAGMFLCGLGHGPKSLEESIAQAKGAAARAATVLAQKQTMVGGPVAEVNEDLCVACLTCLRICPISVPRINERHFAQIDPAACRGCGNCASSCPQGAIQVWHFRDDKYVALLEAC